MNYLSKNLKILRKLKGVNQTQIADLVGKSHTTVGYWEKDMGEPTSSDIYKICRYFDILIEDLISKDLSDASLMAKFNNKYNGQNASPNASPSASLNQYKDTESNIASEPEVAYGKSNPVHNSIPLVGIKAVGGFGNTSFVIEKKDIKDYYSIPKFNHKKVDFMIEVEGASMYPKYNSGDVVACTKINDKSFIQWNKTHVIATKEQGILIKRIKQGSTPDTLLMVSDNQSYDPFEIPKTEIEGLALVVGVIRLE